MPDGGDFPGGKGGGPTPFSNAFKPATIASLRYNTSQAGSPVPLVYGCQRVSINLLEFWGEQGFGSSSKGGKGLGSSAARKARAPIIRSMSPSASARGRSTSPARRTAFSTARLGRTGCGPTARSPASTGRRSTSTAATTARPPTRCSQSADPNSPVLGYSGTSYVTGTPLQLGSTPALPNISFEITGSRPARSGPHFPGDANPAEIVIDLLTNPRYGAGFPGGQPRQRRLDRRFRQLLPGRRSSRCRCCWTASSPARAGSRKWPSSPSRRWCGRAASSRSSPMATWR